MPRINIQFHALPEELLQFVKQCAADFHLHVVVMRWFPFHAEEIPIEMLDDIVSDPSSYIKLGLTLQEPLLPVKSNTDFCKLNPDQLGLSIQKIGKKGLE